jgi:hypothetical protein
MIPVDWIAVMLGLAAGAVMGAIFFLGLAAGMQLALRSRNTIGILSLSAVLRIAALLAVGWTVVERGGPWAFAGYGAAFLAARFIATALARGTAPAGSTP